MEKKTPTHGRPLVGIVLALVGGAIWLWLALTADAVVRKAPREDGAAETPAAAESQPAETEVVVTGEVVDEQGQPVAGAHVYLYHSSVRVSGEEPLCRATTKSDGRFRLPVPAKNAVDKRQFGVRAVADGYSIASRDVVAGYDVTLKVEPTARVHGFVHAEPGEVRVMHYGPRLEDGVYRQGACLVSDGEGRYLVPDAHRYANCVLEILPRSGLPYTETVGVHGAESVQHDIDLTPERVVRCTVVLESGKPVAGASFRIETSEGLRTVATSREDGALEVVLRGKPAAGEGGWDSWFSAWFEVSAPGCCVHMLPVMSLGRSDTVRLKEGRWLEGRVLHPDGRPAAGATVTSLESSSRYTTYSFPAAGAKVLTDDDGRFRILSGCTQPGGLEVRLGDASTRVPDPRDSPLVITLPTGLSIGGRVSTPARVQLFLNGVTFIAEQETAQGGTFLFDELEPMDYKLVVHHEDGAEIAGPVAAYFDLSEGSVWKSMGLEPRSRRIRGCLVDAEGTPARDRAVLVSQAGDRYHDLARTQEDGCFEVQVRTLDPECRLLVRGESLVFTHTVDEGEIEWALPHCVPVRLHLEKKDGGSLSRLRGLTFEGPEPGLGGRVDRFERVRFHKYDLTLPVGRLELQLQPTSDKAAPLWVEVEIGPEPGRVYELRL